MPNDHFSWTPFGLQISKKIELLALAAFIIATVTLISQIRGCIEGPDVVLFPPDQIFIMKDSSYTDGKARVRFGATMVYVNKGQKGYNGIVKFEKIRFRIKNKAYENFWERFGEFDGEPGKIEFKNPRSVKPFSVAAGGTASHQTYFIAWPQRCPSDHPEPCNPLENHTLWDDFVEELNSRVGRGEKEYTFEFKTEVYNESDISTSCSISINEKIVKTIEFYQEYSPTCFPD
jgi:hypothetical protein